MLKRIISLIVFSLTLSGIISQPIPLAAQQTQTGPINPPTLGTIILVDGSTFPSAGGTFAGTYSAGTTYTFPQTVTSSGADWICLSTCLAVTPAAASAGSPQLWAPFDTSGAGLAATQADAAFFYSWGQVQACASGFNAYCSVSLVFGNRVGGYNKNGDWVLPTNTFGYSISLFGQGRNPTWIHQTASTLNYMINSPNVSSSGGQTIEGITLDANLLAGGCLSHHLRRSLVNDVVCWNPQQQGGGTIGAAMWLGSGADAYESKYSHLLVRGPTYNGLVAAYGTASVTSGAITSITWGGTGTNLNLPVTAGPGLVAYFMGKGIGSASWKPCGTMPVVSSIALTGGSINTGSGVGGFTFSSAGATCGGTIYVRVQAAGTLNQAYYLNGSDSTVDDIVTSGDFKQECEYTNGPVLLSHEHPYCAAPYQIEATGGYQVHSGLELDSPIQYGMYMGGTGGTVVDGAITVYNAAQEFGAGDFLIDAASGPITITSSGCYPGSPQNFGGYAKFTGTTLGPMTTTTLVPASTTFISGSEQNCDGTSTLWGTFPASGGGGLPTATAIGQVPTYIGAGTTATAQIPLGGSTWYYPVEWYGAVGDATGAAGVGTDNTTAIQACLTAVASAGKGQCLLQAKKYRITSALTIGATSVGISGQSYGAWSTAISNQLSASAPVSSLVIDSATADAVDAAGSSISAPISFNRFNDFTIIRTVAATTSGSGCGTGTGPAGLSIKFAGGFVVDRVWSEDSACNFYFQNAGAYGTGYVSNSGSMWGANGFNPGIPVYGFFYNGAQSAESFRLRDSFSQTVYPGFSGVPSVGLIVTGANLNDIFVRGFETAFHTFGEYLQQTGSGGSVASSDIHLIDCINDAFFQDGTMVDSLTQAKGSAVEIKGGWNSTGQAGASNDSAGIRIKGSSGITINSVHFLNNFAMKYGVLVDTGSSGVGIIGNNFLNLSTASISLNSASDITATGNVISAATGNTQTMIQGVSLTRSVMAGNTLGGTATTGVSLDAGSANNSYTGVSAIDPTHITTPVSNSGSNNGFDISGGGCVSPNYVQSITQSGVVTCNTPSGSGGGAWTLIQKQTVSSPTASVTFSAIPGTYNNLVLMASFTAATTSDNLAVQFNSDVTSGHYAWGLNFQNANIASAANSASDGSCLIGGGTGMINMTIPAYAAASTAIQDTTQFSELVIGGQSISGTSSCVWVGTDITSLVLAMHSGGNINSGMFTLYGIN